MSKFESDDLTAHARAKETDIIIRRIQRITAFIIITVVIFAICLSVLFFGFGQKKGAANSIKLVSIPVTLPGDEPKDRKESDGRLDALSRLEQFIDEGNYEYAVSTYKEFDLLRADAGDDLLQKLEKLRLSYRDEKIAQAIEAYQSEGYEHALSIIEDSLALMEQDSKLEQYRELFAASAEVPLNNHFIMCDHGYEPLYSTEFTDLYENFYPYGFVFFLDYDSFKESYATFALNEKYTDFRFTYFPEKNYSADDTYSNKRSLKIYGDDTLLFDTGGVSRTDKPQTVTIDVTGVEFLKITAGSGSFWVGDGATGTMVLAEGKVWKQLQEEDYNLIDALYTEYSTLRRLPA